MTADDVRAAVAAITAEFVRARSGWWFPSGESRRTATGARLLDAPDDALMVVAIEAMREGSRRTRGYGDDEPARQDWMARSVALDLAACALRRKLAWTEPQLAELLEAFAATARDGQLTTEYDPVKPVVLTLERHCAGRPAAPALHEPVRRIAESLQWSYAEDRRVRTRLLALLHEREDVPLPPSDDPWTAALLAARGERGDALLVLAGKATSSRPGKQFSADRDAFVAAHGATAVGDAAAALLTAACGVRPTQVVPPHVGDVLRGLAWIGAAAGGEPVGRALGDLALRGWTKVPSHGPACSKAANAALAALGELPGAEGQLGRVRVQLKQPAARKAADAAVDRASARLGIAREEFEERVVPDFGLGPDGARSDTLGEHVATLKLTPVLTCELQFAGPSGKPLKSAPAAVRRDHADSLAELRQTAKDVKSMAAAQRLRLERLLLTDRSWEYAAWRASYLDHGLVGMLARNLIWVLDLPDGPRSVISRQAALVDVNGDPVEPGEARVSLWHPVDTLPAEVLAWRRFLEEHEIRQPFKQAHREVYLLTDAERATGDVLEPVRRSRPAPAPDGRARACARLDVRAPGRVGHPGRTRRAATCPSISLRVRVLDRSGRWRHRGLQRRGRVHSRAHRPGALPHPRRRRTRPTVDARRRPPARSRSTRSRRACSRRRCATSTCSSASPRSATIRPGPTAASRSAATATTGTSYAFGELGEAADDAPRPPGAAAPAAHDRRPLPASTAASCSSAARSATYKIHLGSGNILMEPNDAVPVHRPRPRTPRRPATCLPALRRRPRARHRPVQGVPAGARRRDHGPDDHRADPGELAALPDLQPVAVRVLELRDRAPGEFEDVRRELDAARLQLLGCLVDVVGLDRDRRRGAPHRRLGLPRCPGPEKPA